MPRHGDRVTIATNVYKDATRIAAVARGAGTSREKRFPLGTALKTIRDWQDKTRAKLRREAKRLKGLRGTLEGDVAVYLQDIPAGPKRRDALNLLGHWVTAFGAKRRTAIHARDVQRVMDQWTADGVAASTVKHRRRALVSLWTALDGAKADNPAAETRRPVEPKPEARALPIDVAQAIVEQMPDTGQRLKGMTFAGPWRSKTRARLRVMLWTGVSQATLMRIRPADIDLEAKTLYVRPRRKGAGVSGQTQPLLPEAVEALRDFLLVRAWGAFSTDSMNASFARAVAAYQATHPHTPLLPHLRPYDLRHTFLTEIFLRSQGNLKLVKELGQHADIRTSERYIQAAVAVSTRESLESVARSRGTAAEKRQVTPDGSAT
jgi:integrase